jgi:Molybdopterin-binding domain of aldehyde dehydrogenase
MNKRPARNQIEGSVVMGVGTVLFEKRSYDRRGGEACWPSVMRLRAEHHHVARSDSRDGTVVFVMDRF